MNRLNVFFIYKAILFVPMYAPLSIIQIQAKNKK